MVKPDSPQGEIDGLIIFTFDLNGSFSQKVIDYLDNSGNTYTGTYKLTDNNTIIILFRSDIGPVKY